MVRVADAAAKELALTAAKHFKVNWLAVALDTQTHLVSRVQRPQRMAQL